MRLTSRAGILFVGVLMALLVFLMAARTPLDSDLFWHLRAGEEMLRSGQPLLTDSFSFTRAGSHWVNHSWLAEVILALANRLGGTWALGGLTAAAAAASLAVLYPRMAGHPLWRAAVMVLAALVLAPVWSPRPQIFSLVLFAVLLTLLSEYGPARRRLPAILPVLFVVWSNLHGGFALGLIALAATLAGEGLDLLLRRPSAPKPVEWGQLAAASVLSGLAILINPNGLDTWRIPFQTVGVEVLQRAIPEWASPDFHDITQLPMAFMLAGGLAVLGLSGKPARGGELARVLAFMLLALIARRNFGPFALCAALLIADHGWEVIARLLRVEEQAPPQRIPDDSTEKPAAVAARPEGWTPPPAGAAARLASRTEQTFRRLNLAIIAMVGLAAFLKLGISAHPALVSAYTQAQYPVGAAAWLRENRPAGNLFNEYAWGGYLIWALPEYPVYVDGRTDLFGDEIIGEWLHAVQAGPGWEEIFIRRGVNLALLEPSSPLAGALEKSGWQVAFRDDHSVLFKRSGP